MIAKLEKTSVQLAPEMLRDMEAWPGLTRSEAIRLSVERAHYLSTLKAEEISAIASRYEPILMPALEDFGYQDFRTVARALPAIVTGFLRENSSTTWKDAVGQHLDSSTLIKELEQLHVADRIGILDCIVAQRNRTAAARNRPPTAEDFRLALEKEFAAGERIGKNSVTIRAGKLHLSLGGYPSKKNNRMPVCCRVMKKMMGLRDKVLESPPSGQGANLVIEYKLPRTAN